MKFDDFKKKESPIVKFVNKYFGMKYSVGFAIGKQLLKEKPTATGVISTLIVFHSLWVIVTESNYIFYLILIWITTYAIKLIIKLHKKRKNGKTKK